MRIIKYQILLIVVLLFFACNKQQNTTEQKSVFKKSYISFMSGNGPDSLEELSVLNPSVIAWGSDPINADLDVNKFSKNISVYKKMGLPLIASNVWMLTATDKYMYEHPEYQKAVCVDIEGNPIVPRWLDSNYKGVMPAWGCTNNPLYKSLLKERAIVGIKSGANMLHLDDHMGTCAASLHASGCYCEYCMTGFRNWLKSRCNSSELDSMGISDINRFLYSTVVKEAGYTTGASCYGEAVKDSIPLYNEFLSFQREAISDFVKELSEIADSIAGKHIPVGVNAWNLLPTQFATSQYADYFCNEIKHYDLEDLIPPFSYMLGNALQKPLFSTATGEDWIHIMQKESFTRIRRWIATAYSFGNYFMYAYNQWAQSEETGTQWYRFPEEAFEPYSSFIHDNSFLFDDFVEYKYAAVLYDNKAFRLGNESAKDISRILHYKQVPVSLAVLGDEWLKFDITPEKLNEFEYLIIPEKAVITPNQNKLFANFFDDNKLIRWSDSIDINTIIPSLIKVTGAEKVWTIPRIKQSENKDAEIVIHLLNQDYNAEFDKMNTKTKFNIKIDNTLLANNKCSSVCYYTPSNKKLELVFERQDDGVVIQIPLLDNWGILKIN